MYEDCEHCEEEYKKLHDAIEDVHNKGRMTDEEYIALCAAAKELRDKEVDDGK